MIQRTEIPRVAALIFVLASVATFGNFYVYGSIGPVVPALISHK